MARRILITRNKDFAERTKKDLANLSLSSVAYPLYKIEGFKPSIAGLKDVNIVITSRNALNLLSKAEIKALNQRNKFLLVGESFYFYLKELGIKNIKYFINSAELLTFLKENQGNYHYLRGEKITLDLKSYIPKLTEEICYKICYFSQTAKELNSFIKKENITDLVFFSQENAKYFINITDKQILSQYKIYCLSKRIAEVFADFNKNIIYPEIPTYNNLIKCLASH